MTHSYLIYAGEDIAFSDDIEALKYDRVKGIVDVSASGRAKTAQSVIKRLKKGQQITAKFNGQQGMIEPLDYAKMSGWQSGRLVYRNARLADVITEVNRYRDVKIKLDGSGIGDIAVTMSLNVKETDKLLTGLLETQPVKLVYLDKIIKIMAINNFNK